MDIQELKLKPIKKINFEKFNEYKKIKIDIKSSEYQEKLVDLKNYEINNENSYFSKYTAPYFHKIPNSIQNNLIRESIALKLVEINQILNKYDLELFIFDAYRPMEVQKYFFEKWVPNYLKKLYPNLTEKEISEKVEEYWTKPSNSKKDLNGENLPPHSTGAAIDLSIRNKKTKQLLEMGSIFDDLSEISHLYHFEKDLDDKSFTYIEAKQNRRLLFNLMISKKFAPHPKEWWHFSYGDQMWANFYSKNKAFYGYIKNE